MTATHCRQPHNIQTKLILQGESLVEAHQRKLVVVDENNYPLLLNSVLIAMVNNTSISFFTVKSIKSLPLILDYF